VSKSLCFRFESAVFDCQVNIHALHSVKCMLGLLPQQLASSVQQIPASQPLFPDCLPHPLAKRSEYGGFCMPTRDAKNRFAVAKCAFTVFLSLKLLSALPKERISLSGSSAKDMFLGFRAIMRRYCHVPVSARRESCFSFVAHNIAHVLLFPISARQWFSLLLSS
jgi:hypothetical protein